MQDVRKELNFCAKTKIRVIGVLENMNQLLIPLSHLNFVERKTGRDQTEYVRGVLQQCDLQQCDASITIFQCALDNSPQSMAARFNVPYLGALPLDPSLQRACESGTCLVCQCQQHSPAFTPFVRLVDNALYYHCQQSQNTQPGIDQSSIIFRLFAAGLSWSSPPAEQLHAVTSEFVWGAR